MSRERRGPRQPDRRKGKEYRDKQRDDSRKPREAYKPFKSRPGTGKYDRPPRKERAGKEVREKKVFRTDHVADNDKHPTRGEGIFKGKKRYSKYTSPGKDKGEYIPKWQREEETMRLNKYIANAGVCSRREADDLIKAGVVTVNGKVVTELGIKVKLSDRIVYGGQLLSSEKKRYLLLNKQKGYVTTTKDPHAKNTVMELIAGACKERIYPVGRLDRNTTGLLLFTNDGELSKKLMHPSSRITKLYHVVLDQPLKKADMVKIAGGVELEDGLIKVDSLAYDITASDKRELGVEIHSGKNRVIRRIFESLGYKVTKLDRVMFAGLTKKNLPRGKWRFLSEKEISILKRL